MKPDSARRVEQARARFARVPFAQSLGVTVAEVARDRAVLVLPYRAEHMNAAGVLNGGASASLLTMAGTLAAWTGLDLDAGLSLGCVDLAMQYLAAATEEDVVAQAFLDVALHSGAGTPICRGLVTYRASDYGGRAPRLRAQHVPLPAPSPLTPPAERRLFRGYVEKLGMTPVHQGPGRVRLHMPCTPGLLDEQGPMHAGALASIMDIAAVAASWSLVPRRPGARGSTIGMQVSYPGASAEPVVADAHVQQRAEEVAASGQLVAMGQVSDRLLEPGPGPE